MSAENKLASAINSSAVEFARFLLHQLRSTQNVQEQTNILEAYEAGSDCDFLESRQDDGSILREAEFNSTEHDNISDELSNAALDLKYAIYAASKDFIKTLKDEIISEVRDCLKLELKMEIISELGKLNMLNDTPTSNFSQEPSRPVSRRGNSDFGLETSGHFKLQDDDLKFSDSSDDLPECLRNNQMFSRVNNALNRVRQTGGSYYTDDDLIAYRRGRMDPNDPSYSFDFDKLREISFEDDNNINAEFDRLFAEKFGDK